MYTLRAGSERDEILVTHEARGRITGKSGELDLYFGDSGGYFEIAPDGGGAAIAGRQLLVVGVDDANDQRRMCIARLWL